MYINKYELMVITYANYSDEEKEKVITYVKDLLTTLEAQNIELTIMGDRTLAYPIKKQSQGYYFYLNFSLNSSKLKSIEEKLNIKETLIRYMVVKDEKEKIMQKIANKDKARTERKELKKKIVESKKYRDDSKRSGTGYSYHSGSTYGKPSYSDRYETGQPNSEEKVYTARKAEYEDEYQSSVSTEAHSETANKTARVAKVHLDKEIGEETASIKTEESKIKKEPVKARVSKTVKDEASEPVKKVRSTKTVDSDASTEDKKTVKRTAAKTTKKEEE